MNEQNENNLITITDELAKLFFVHTPPALLLDGTIEDRRFPCQQFEELMRCYVKGYSDTEIRLIYNSQKIGKQNVFLCIVQLGHELLTLKNNQICCRYESLLRWREISRYVGEDLLVCGYLADRLLRYRKTWTKFSWPQVLGHDNKQLNAVLHRGISDNHFHLFGSAPVFPLAWIRMMNDVKNGKYMAGLMGIQLKRRNFQYHLGENYEEYSPAVLILQAALMRALMYSCLKDRRKDSEIAEAIPEYISLLKLGSELLQSQQPVCELINRLQLECMTVCGRMMPDYLLEQSSKEMFRDSGQAFADGWSQPENSNYAFDLLSSELFCGERKLVYDMLCDILVYNRLPEQVQGMLYPYLIIRTWFRGEMVQSNDNVGFENFQVYSRRKNDFLLTSSALTGKSFRCLYGEAKERRQNLEWMVQHAVFESFRPGNLKSLEIRIAPSDDYRSNVEQILCYDGILRKNKDLSMDHFFYVYHFVKRPDRKRKTIEEDSASTILICRHYRLRKELEKKANAIRKMRQIRPEIAARVRGIDACSSEIGCRPEVFACVFRSLKADVVQVISSDARAYATETYAAETPYSSGINEDYTCKGYLSQPSQLSVTYHAGEDFLDPIDGLRALDEAVRFLEMSYGDRLGHATVLGLSLDKWYEKKSWRIYIPVQDYLDNVVWFYHKLFEFRIENCEYLKEHLLREFLKYYIRIYGEKESCQTDIDIFAYYKAWQLRGDPPEFYVNGKYEQPHNPMFDLYQSPQVDGMAADFMENEDIRQNAKIVGLYYRYHFDERAKSIGETPEEIRIPHMYAEGAILVQKEMQRMISQRGVAIETNPSSNLMISTMDSYAEHPILNLYNMGLEDDHDCAQMLVSVNTDDRGVFHTSLENEYALLASSVENIRNADGTKIYNPQNVYEWLDRIRVMGNEQVF